MRLTRASYLVLSSFLATLALIAVVWWPLVADYLAWIDPRRPIWTQLDWLLLGIFAFMTVLITAGADLRQDVCIAAIGLVGGMVIESWGTQTGLWSYFTHERPPLWILPAWPVASLAIDRLTSALDRLLAAGRLLSLCHPLIFCSFLVLLVAFSWPSRAQPLTPMVWALCLLLTLSPGDRRQAVLTFAAGAGLGYLLELWGTTRQCWTYYTLQTPPLFAVLAHGMAAAAFWRVGTLIPRATDLPGALRRLRLSGSELPNVQAIRPPGRGGPPA